MFTLAELNSLNKYRSLAILLCSTDMFLETLDYLDMCKFCIGSKVCNLP